MKRLFDPFINEQKIRIQDNPGKCLLSEQAYSRFLDFLQDTAAFVGGKTALHLVVEEVGDENPLARMNAMMLTKRQKEEALERLAEKQKKGAGIFPEIAEELIRNRLYEVTNAFLEMLDRMFSHREEICRELTRDRVYTVFQDIKISAGDYHNHGRQVMIITTDVGSLVYKPRDMRGEREIYRFINRFFSDILIIPRCIAFSDEFGVSEFVEKARAEGREEAELYYRNLGGLAALFSVLGSTDMHVENIGCQHSLPVLYDLENFISPIIYEEGEKEMTPGLSIARLNTLVSTGFLPGNTGSFQTSVLLNTEEFGSAPVIDGKKVKVYGFTEKLYEGYRMIFERISENKDEILKAVEPILSTMLVRMLIRPTQFYYDTIKKLYHNNALKSKESYEKTVALAEKYLKSGSRPEYDMITECEIKQMANGDVPYFYTLPDSRNLYSYGMIVAEGMFDISAGERVRKNISDINRETMEFDLAFIDRSLRQFPDHLDEETEPTFPEIEKETLSYEAALREAGHFFERVKNMSLTLPGGAHAWGCYSAGDDSYMFCQEDLETGLLGISLFLSAYAEVTGDEDAKRFADENIDETFRVLRMKHEYLLEKGLTYPYIPNLGESEGMGGLLKGLALLRRVTDREDIKELSEYVIDIFRRLDVSIYTVSDRLIGLSGALGVICRFEEYRDNKDIIVKLADKILDLRNLPYKDTMLWKTFPDKKRLISGAGHGQMGIAEALYLAYSVTRDERYKEAAHDAVIFELETYSEKFGSWPDLRRNPPIGIVHGYCSGSPGIGIMAKRIMDFGIEDEAVRKCAELSKKSVFSLKTNIRDHLCCGNSALVEYYMFTGERERAGRLLLGMINRSKRIGEYCYLAPPLHNEGMGSLLYGVSGVGYEFLHYACPDKVPGIY